MAILIIPIAISVHSVVAFIFSMNLRPGWDSTIFGIYFVIGAIFSGIATILIAMAIFRKIFHLEEYINGKHFRYLSYLLLTMLMLYLYLTVSEYLTVGYKLEVEEKQLLDILMFGNNAPWFWLFVVGGMLIPAFLIILKRWPVIPRIVVAAILVNIGMWFKRFVIIIPTLEVPLMPYEFGVYNPTWVEWSITAGALAAFILVFSILVKLMPIISIWEVAEEVEPHPSAPLVELGKRS
jgi:molybdopterin-containing oxidoreductase family membrane subunit